jgi:hypothetical protein
MFERLISEGSFYLTTLLECALLWYLLRRDRWRDRVAPGLYVLSLFVIDSIARQLVCFKYGFRSPVYGYFYWLSDVFLALAAFGLICALFRRACKDQPHIWSVLRLTLTFVLLLVAVITYISLSHNYKNLFSMFIVEFQQNLYFTCLVLNTLLYMLMQQVESEDEELGLLVCGLGIQFAGPTAALAIVHLTEGHSIIQQFYALFSPSFTIAMLVTWLYAVSRRVPIRTVQGVRKPRADSAWASLLAGSQ